LRQILENYQSDRVGRKHLREQDSDNDDDIQEVEQAIDIDVADQDGRPDISFSSEEEADDAKVDASLAEASAPKMAPIGRTKDQDESEFTEGRVSIRIRLICTSLTHFA